MHLFINHELLNFIFVNNLDGTFGQIVLTCVVTHSYTYLSNVPMFHGFVSGWLFASPMRVIFCASKKLVWNHSRDHSLNANWVLFQKADALHTHTQSSRSFHVFDKTWVLKNRKSTQAFIQSFTYIIKRNLQTPWHHFQQEQLQMTAANDASL